MSSLRDVENRLSPPGPLVLLSSLTPAVVDTMVFTHSRTIKRSSLAFNVWFVYLAGR